MSLPSRALREFTCLPVHVIPLLGVEQIKLEVIDGYGEIEVKQNRGITVIANTVRAKLKDKAILSPIVEVAHLFHRWGKACFNVRGGRGGDGGGDRGSLLRWSRFCGGINNASILLGDGC